MQDDASTSDQRIVASRSALARRVGDDTVLLDVERGTYYSLNEVGGVVWELLAVPRTVEQLCDEIVSRYDVDVARCRAEVRALIDELVSRGLAAPHEAGG